jgi:hypothetical protein
MGNPFDGGLEEHRVVPLAVVPEEHAQEEQGGVVGDPVLFVHLPQEGTQKHRQAYECHYQRLLSHVRVNELSILIAHFLFFIYLKIYGL